jgi:hypothetical protein
MPRNKVDEDKDRTCSYGLHFCSISYLPHFSDSCGGHTMIVKINPKDVVAIPADYNNTKGRTCRYEVIGEYTEDWRSKIGRGENGFDFPLYSSDGGEYEGDDEQVCEDCGTILDNYDDNETLCNSCAKDDDEFDCKDWNKHQSQFVGNPDCDENHCFCDKQDEHGDISCDMDKNQVGNTGDDHLCGGASHDDNAISNSIPNTASHTYHNVRDEKGRFTKKEVNLLNAIKQFFNKN